MADGVHIDFAGLNTVTAAFAVESAKALLKGAEVVRASAQRVVATAQSFVPVDTGATRSSIHATTTQAGLAGVEAEIGPTTHYAPFLEYGTVKMAPHAFMGPALDRETPAFVEALSQIPGLFE